jgi:hypothetical protein
MLKEKSYQINEIKYLKLFNSWIDLPFLYLHVLLDCFIGCQNMFLMISKQRTMRANQHLISDTNNLIRFLMNLTQFILMTHWLIHIGKIRIRLNIKSWYKLDLFLIFFFNAMISQINYHIYLYVSVSKRNEASYSFYPSGFDF